MDDIFFCPLSSLKTDNSRSRCHRITRMNSTRFSRLWRKQPQKLTPDGENRSLALWRSSASFPGGKPLDSSPDSRRVASLGTRLVAIAWHIAWQCSATCCSMFNVHIQRDPQGIGIVQTILCIQITVQEKDNKASKVKYVQGRDYLLAAKSMHRFRMLFTEVFKPEFVRV